MNAGNRAYLEAAEAERLESGISSAAELRERGNLALCEARVLARYTGRDQELTKPSVMLLDWVGEDEVTVRWDALRGQLGPDGGEQAGEDDDYELFAPKRFRGIGARAGGVMLGVVLGVAVTIGLLAIFAPREEPAAPSPNGETVVSSVADGVPAALAR